MAKSGSGKNDRNDGRWDCTNVVEVVNWGPVKYYNPADFTVSQLHALVHWDLCTHTLFYLYLIPRH